MCLPDIYQKDIVLSDAVLFDKTKNISLYVVMYGTQNQEVDFEEEEAALFDNSKWCTVAAKYDGHNMNTHTGKADIYTKTCTEQTILPEVAIQDVKYIRKNQFTRKFHISRRAYT